ncbi:MAG: LacI family DNA-binding transcriptional regulator [Clostridium celatum]|nr:LacI family DNA-binding transcriptional regulator [Clostridium celatum]
MKTIMQDIAKIAGVSPGTVSNALNDRKGVGKDTKEKIIKIAEEMGYFRNTKKNDGKIIRLIKYKKNGHVVADTPFFSSLIEACEKECRKNGYELLISQVVYGEHTKEDVHKIVNHHKIDGILLLATEMDESDFKYFEGIEIPMVVVDSYFKEIDYDYVVINNTKGAYSATKYLIAKGHKNIGLLGSNIEIKNFKYRLEGYIKTLNTFGIEFNENNNIYVDPTIEGAYSDFKVYLEKNKDNLPSAFFALNDIIALGAMKAMNEAGISIPNDVSIVGFDDIPFSSYSNPGVTTVKVHTKTMGKTAVKKLMESIENDIEITLKIEINTELIERESVKSL